jgi:flagellar hook-associated protein 3 FlgL
MRISNTYQFNILNQRVQRTQEDLFTAQQKLMTGLDFETLAQNPSDGVAVVNAKSIKARLAQYDSNLRVANEYLTTTESEMQSLGDVLQKAYTLAVSGANVATEQSGRDGMAKQVAEMQEQVLLMANAQSSNGKYIFAGQSHDAKPFSVSGAALAFAGDSDPIHVEIRPSEVMRVNLENADTHFQQVYDDLETLKNNLLSGDLVALSDNDVQNMQDRADETNLIRGTIGAKMQRVEKMAAENLRRQDELDQRISEVQEVDFTEAYVKLKQKESAYQAALTVTSRNFGISLMDFMR